MKKKVLWLDAYPVDVSDSVVVVAGLPEPATRPDGTPDRHPEVDEEACWLPLTITVGDASPVRRSVKVPASAGTGLEVGMVVTLGGVTVTPYPSKGWARGSLTARTVVAAVSPKPVPRRSPAGGR